MSIVKHIITCLAMLLAHTAIAQPRVPDTIRVPDFGIQPNSFEDAVPAVQKAIDACRQKQNVVLYFPRGRYDFWPQYATIKEYYISNTSSEEELPQKHYIIGMLFENMKNITVEGDSSLFVFHGKMTCWVFDHCENMRMTNVQIDFERPSMSEMTLKEITSSSVVAEINPQSTFTIMNNVLQWYGEGWGMKNYHAILVNPFTGVNTYSSWVPFMKSKAEQTGKHQVKFTGDFSAFHAEPGDVLTIRDPLRDQVGVWINHSKDVVFDHVTFDYMHGLGLVSQFSENLSFNYFNAAPPANSGRVISCFADALHFSGCRGEIKIENSHFKGLHDDPVNVHGTHLKIQEIMSPLKLKMAFMHPQTYGFEAFFEGDSISFVHAASLKAFGKGVIKAAALISKKEMVIELTQPIPGETIAGDCLENITWTPSVTISHCRFESVNTRGLLVTTPGKVLIQENTFYRTGMAAILIADDALSWYESGQVRDITIRENKFEECGYNSSPNNYPIIIEPENHELIEGYFVHKNIRIETNTFTLYDTPLLSVRSTHGLIFSNNTIVPGNLMKPSLTKPSIQINASKEIFIQNNKFTTAWDAKISLMKTPVTALKTDMKNIEVSK